MKKDRGFTLIEVVMVIVLTVIIAGVVAMPLAEGVKGWFYVTVREDISQSGRIAMERMVREVRNTARGCITTATSTAFAFGTDLSNCGAIDFSRAGAGVPYTIQRNGIDLADNVQSLTFTYYDNANNDLGTPVAVTANIRRVAIEIVSINSGETASKYSEVYLANM
jgi:prepilin-type N-terminal cleavage/methylation domain-containing protein